MVRPNAGRGAGYTLAALVVMTAVISILVAAALPVWSRIVKGESEEELIFRGLQYAEAIRVFQVRNGRFPVSLEELLQVNPRCIRQLWTDPMTESGEWGLIFASLGGGQQGQGQAQPGRPRRPTVVAPPPPADGRRGRQQATGPIIGVRSLSDEEAVKGFLGGTKHSSWHFTADLIPLPQIIPGAVSVPRATSDWIGRPFREGLNPLQGQAPGIPGGNTPDEAGRVVGADGRPGSRRGGDGG